MKYLPYSINLLNSTEALSQNISEAGGSVYTVEQEGVCISLELRSSAHASRLQSVSRLQKDGILEEKASLAQPTMWNGILTAKAMPGDWSFEVCTIDGHADLHSFTIVTPLPVEMTDFDAEVIDTSSAKFMWSTAWKYNNSGFDDPGHLSAMKSVRIDQDLPLSLYPNPVVEGIFIREIQMFKSYLSLFTLSQYVS